MNLARRKPEQPLSARHGKQYAIESWPDLPRASPRAQEPDVCISVSDIL